MPQKGATLVIYTDNTCRSEKNLYNHVFCIQAETYTLLYSTSALDSSSKACTLGDMSKHYIHSQNKILHIAQHGVQHCSMLPYNFSLTLLPHYLVPALFSYQLVCGKILHLEKVSPLILCCRGCLLIDVINSKAVILQIDLDTQFI